MLPFGSPTGVTKVHLTRQQLGKLFGPHLKCSASLLGGATIEKLVFEIEPNGCSQKLGGSILWFPCERCHSGEEDLFQLGQAFFCGHLQGWIFDWTQVMFRDIDLNHQSCSRLHDHVKSLRVSDLGQG